MPQSNGTGGSFVPVSCAPVGSSFCGGVEKAARGELSSEEFRELLASLRPHQRGSITIRANHVNARGIEIAIPRSFLELQNQANKYLGFVPSRMIRPATDAEISDIALLHDGDLVYLE